MKTAKIYIVFILMLGFISGFAQQSALDQFFERYQDDPEFSVIFVSPKMFQMLARVDTDDPEADEIMELVKGINGLRILIKDEGDGRALYDEAFSKISKNGFEELLTVRDKGENVRFMVREGVTEDVIKQLVLLVGGQDDFVMMDLTGNIDLKTVGKLGRSIDVPGVEHLKELEKH